MAKPSQWYSWSQGKQHLTVGSGVCYGLCVKLGKEVKQTTDLERTFDRISTLLANRSTLQSAISKQKGEAQYARPRIEPPIPPNIAVNILCNTASSAGWCTRYSLFSYANPFAWFGNHACLMWHGEGGTLIFDPNTGLALWPKITNPGYAAVTRMLDWGYAKIGMTLPVYVWGFESVIRGAV